MEIIVNYGKMSELDIELLKSSVRNIISICDNYKMDINIKLISK